jgi:plastocyanin
MSTKLAALSVAVAAALLAACAGRYNTTGATGATGVLPGMGPDLQITYTLPKGATLPNATGTISEELPSEGLGTIKDSFWSATLGGYTQQQFSQALGFPPGTKLTIKNISKTIHHTLNVVKKIAGPPAVFPSNPTLSTTPSGGKLKKGYASGSINPGSSVKVTLGKAGVYLIGCAFHYHSGMQDVLVVHTGATPGPQATAPAAR